MSRYGIVEWFGESFRSMPPSRRQYLARAALGREPAPQCPFQAGRPGCSKKGGVCSIGLDDGVPVIVCPKRFEQGDLVPRWLGRIVGFDEIFLAREVPFMRSPTTKRPAGRIDQVVASDRDAGTWFGLEIQAVYFSGPGMQRDFEALLEHEAELPPKPTAVRRPDWRSSSAKRLMPQLQVKTPTLRRWGTKLAVAVDEPFFVAIGGPSANPSHDLNDGDVIWLVPRVNNDLQLAEHHWEVLSLEDSSNKLLSARTVKRDELEETLRSKLKPLNDGS